MEREDVGRPGRGRDPWVPLGGRQWGGPCGPARPPRGDAPRAKELDKGTFLSCSKNLSKKIDEL